MKMYSVRTNMGPLLIGFIIALMLIAICVPRSDVETVCFFLMFGIVPLLVCWFQYSKANEALLNWAQSSGVELITAERRYLRTGPFFLAHDRGDAVFKIVVRDQDGINRSGWLRVGIWWLYSNQTKVIWDESGR
jgi:hypothetical protein